MTRNNTLLLLTFLIFPASLLSQVKVSKMPVKPWEIICYAAEGHSDFHVPPPESYRNRLKGENANEAIFIIKYSFNTPPAARTAMQMAADIWASEIYSTVPIHMEVIFSDKMPPGALAGTLPGTIYKLYNHGCLEPLAYHVATAEKITGRELNGVNEPDIIITFNKDQNWYYGTDQQPGFGEQDFVSVALHEMTHGLGFYGLFAVNDDNQGDYIWKGNYTVFDYYLEEVSGNKLINDDLYPAPSILLYSKLTQAPIFFNSPIMVSLNHDPYRQDMAEMFIPEFWDGGSSLYHLGENYNNTVNSLMTYSQSPGESIHDPGPITLNMFKDISWVYTRIEHDSLKDHEDVSTPFAVSAKFIADTRISGQMVHYSFDKFSSENTESMTYTGVLNEYAADIQIDQTESRVWYYISVVDNYNRTFTYPPRAPENVFTFYAGTDTIDPIVDHLPIDFILEQDDTVKLEASITDNLGIDTVIIEYLINGIEQESFGLYNDSANIYKGQFDFSLSGLLIGDTVRYKITVKDAAMDANIVVSPASGYHSFAVEEIPDFQETYFTSFELTDKDFLKTGFSRLKPEGWSSYALHSDHPYKAPKKDNTEYNFIAQLRIPIRLSQGYMVFREIALIEPGDPGPDGQDYAWDDELQEANQNFWDYVVVEGSTDQGATWHPFEDGWDCRKHPEWDDLFNSIIDARNNISLAIPEEDMYRNHYIDLLDNEYFTEGDTALIRFRLFSDPYFNGWGWAIDYINILPTAIEEYAIVPDAINIYPNPSTGEVNLDLQLKQDAESLVISVYDMVGKIVQTEVYDHPDRYFERRFMLDHLENGIYFFRIESGNQTLTRKFIIAR